MNVVRAAATEPRPRPGTWARSWPLPLITLLGAMACGESFILKQPPAEDPGEEDPSLDPDDDEVARDAGRSRRSDAGASKRTDAGAKRADAGAKRPDAAAPARGDAGATVRPDAGAPTRTERASTASSAAPGATKPAPDEAPDEANEVSLPPAEAETVVTSPANGDELVSPPVQPAPNSPPVGRAPNDPPAGPAASSPAPMSPSAASPTPAATASVGLAPAQPDTSALPAGPGGNSQPATNPAVPSPAPDAGVASSAVATAGCTQREATWRITYATVRDGCFMALPGTSEQHVVNLAEGAAAIGAAAGLSGCLDRSVKSATECSLQVDLDCPAPAPLSALGLRGRLTGTLTFVSASVSGALSINVSRADVTACETSVEARGVPGT